MFEGALILLAGMAIGYGIASYLPTKKKMPHPYDKYRNKDGLYSRKAVRESG